MRPLVRWQCTRAPGTGIRNGQNWQGFAKQFEFSQRKETFRQARFVRALTGGGCYALFQVTFTIAVHGRFVLILTMRQINSPVQLVVQQPQRSHGGLPQDAESDKKAE